ncbi:ABC transporter ATP-binding protein [Streptomyces sp. DSM 41979]|uniref:ABC transporter ATP-binding protein n=1 Tax=Streptomyces evansiae TaxID=3075535 RepID=A0ABU2R823_9ACTN|nr:ABC transporter ATP-binding protein [Streptomyces sp. DSM 41979]MDT0412458.1 ABC transporter ATP-binding protein [Streptomyces sp. DSM 41979]
MTSPLLSVRDLTVSFRGGAEEAVRGVSFELRRGEVLGLVGESGSGKSLTALAVLGLPPGGARVSGSVRLDGTELVGAPSRELDRVRGRRIAMVFQDPLSAFTPVYRIGEQLAEAVRVHTPVSKAVAAERAVELLDLVGIPEPRRRAEAFPHEFSGGMRQRAMIAMAVAHDPDVLLADEPTTALDVTVQAQVLDVLRTAREATGAALLLVSHDLGVIAGTADRVAVMYAGRLVESAPVDELFARPAMPYTLGLLGAVPRPGAPLVPLPGTPPRPGARPDGCPFAPRCPLATDECRRHEPELTPLAGGGPGRGVACLRPEEVVGRTPGEIFRRGAVSDPSAAVQVAASGPPAAAPVAASDPSAAVPSAVVPGAVTDPPAVSHPPADEPVLTVRGLTRTFPLRSPGLLRRRTGTVYAVDGVDLDLRAGRTLGLVGESGSGKSTTLDTILSLSAPESGTVDVLGHRADRIDRATRRALRGDVQIVFQDPMASLDPRLPVADLVAEGPRAQGMGGAATDARVRELIGLVGLDPVRDLGRFPHEFSGGQRQRIGIARALAVRPRLLLLDEPVSALDVSVRAGVLDLLGSLRTRFGFASLLVSHDLAVVRHMADDIAVMYLGATVERGPAEEVFARPRHPYTRALLAAAPVPDPPAERARAARRVLLAGDPPSPTTRVDGCRFRSRCPLYAVLPEADRGRCAGEVPTGEGGVACHDPERREY